MLKIEGLKQRLNDYLDKPLNRRDFVNYLGNIAKVLGFFSVIKFSLWWFDKGPLKIKVEELQNKIKIVREYLEGESHDIEQNKNPKQFAEFKSRFLDILNRFYQLIETAESDKSKNEKNFEKGLVKILQEITTLEKEITKSAQDPLLTL